MHQPPTERSRTRRRIVVAALALPCLVAGGVGLQALTTLESSVDDNTSTVHGAYVPKPALEVTGDPFEIAFHADATITGDTPSDFVITNHGDAAGTWDLSVVAAEDADPDVAAVTQITATVWLHTPKQSGPNYRSGSYDLPLGTLADPVSLNDALYSWKWLNDPNQPPVGRQQFELYGSTIDPGLAYSVTIRAHYRAEDAKALADTIPEGETRVASADVRVTYLSS